MLRLRKFMFDRVYLGPAARARARAGASGRCAASSTTTWSTPSEVPELGARAPSECQRVTDYIAGMTDRFCIAKFAELTIPEEARF